MNWTEGEYAAYMARRGAPKAWLPETTPEGILLAQIRGVAKDHGFLTYHTHDSRKSEQGFPDLVLTNGRRVLIYELKTNTGKVTHDQALWLTMLAYTGQVECGIWRPRDFPAIVASLTQGKA